LPLKASRKEQCSVLRFLWAKEYNATVTQYEMRACILSGWLSIQCTLTTSVMTVAIVVG